MKKTLMKHALELVLENVEEVGETYESFQRCYPSTNPELNLIHESM